MLTTRETLLFAMPAMSPSIRWRRVVRVSAVLTLLLARGGGAAAPALHDAFDAKKALAYTSQVVSFGERWPGSPGHQKTEALIKQVLAKDGARIETDDFTAA